MLRFLPGCAAVIVCTAVLAAPLAFFDATPLGRLMNRFSRDQYAVDESLPFQLNIFLAQTGGLLGTLIVLAYTTEGVFVVVLPVLGAIYYLLQRLYRQTSRELKRLDSVSRSPLFAHFDECVEGVAVIRSHGSAAVRREVSDCLHRLDRNQRVWFLSSAASQWLTFRLQVRRRGCCVSVSLRTSSTTHECFYQVSSSAWLCHDKLVFEALLAAQEWCVHSLPSTRR